MNQKLIVIDGISYRSVDEIPPDVRQKYLAPMGSLDKDNNGTLDMLESMNAFFEDKNNDGIARDLGWELVDIDNDIEKAFSKPIFKIFAEDGEQLT